MPDGSSTAHLYRPKLLTTIAEGYPLASFRKDVMAALTVAIVALPLSMAIAVGSGVSPERGLYTAVIGGVIVSAFGGSRYQIGGPAGAFIVLVAATVTKYGLDGLLLTVFLSGIMLTILGAFRIGSLVRYIPHPVTVGFTAGIATTIAASQIRDFGGLHVTGAEPGALLPKLAALWFALPSVSPATVVIGIGSAALIFAIRYWRPAWPAMLIAVVAASLATLLLHLPVDTIGTRFGAIPNGLPWPRLPQVTLARIREVLPISLSFTLLGGIESLLSAKVADGMTGRKHRSNMELVAQGIANIMSALFGGISVTGTIARTATNIRAGARSSLSGIMHSAFVLLFMLIAAPLASYIPLSALAGLLVVVCWNMIEMPEVAAILKSWRSGFILIVTFGGTILRDLTTGIIAGCAVAAAFYLWDRFAAPKGV